MASLGKFSLLKTTTLALLTLSVLVSCGPAYFPSNVGVTWIGCEVYTNLSLYGNDTSPIPPLPWPPAPINTTAECANLSVPLNYENPNKTITLFVKKVNALEQPSKGQLWLLQGGPGGSGVIMEGLLPSFTSLMPSYDIMIPDHRGVFRSSGLWCPQINDLTPSNLTKCIKYLNKTYGSDLQQFTTTNAARDVATAINMTADSSHNVFLYGVSYGSYWAQRYLMVAPNQATKVAIDGIALLMCAVWQTTTMSTP